MASDNLSSSHARIGILWKNYLNASNGDDRGLDGDDNEEIGSSTTVGGSKTAWLEVFLYEFGKLSDERRTYFQQSNSISETISSVLSRQLLLFIYEICDSSKSACEEQTPRKRASSITSSLSSASKYMTARNGPTNCTSGTAADDTKQVLLHGTTAGMLLPLTTDQQQHDNKIDPDPLDGDPGEDRCTILREFLLEGIGGRILRVLDQIGAKDIVNAREFTEVLIQILPTRKKWITHQTNLEYTVEYNWQLLKVFKMRTGNSDWRNGAKRNSMNLNSSQSIEFTSPVQASSPPAICRMLSCPPVPQEHKVVQTDSDHPQPTNLTDYHTEAFQAHIHTPLSQDRLTMIVLNLLESLVIHENIFMIDEKSVTISCLRMAIERLRRQEVLEENLRNRLILRHKLLGILMLSLNNLFFLDTLESDQVSLKHITSEVMELLRKEVDTSSINPISCDFVYNLTYTIVSTVNQSFMHYCEHLVSEQFFQAIFRLLECNLDIVKHVYGLLHETNGSNGTQQSVIHILLKMLQNFILVLAPNRGTVKKPPRTRHRLHHLPQDPKAVYICALENILLNIFPVVKYSDQRMLLRFFGENQICCCNATIKTLEILLAMTNDDVVPRICLNFANRSVIGAIFGQSSCTRCEGERSSKHFNKRFDVVHCRLFKVFSRVENRSRMPILLKYLQDVVKVVPASLGKLFLFDLVLPQLYKERTEFTVSTLDDTTKDLVNGCLSIVGRCLKSTNLFEEFFTDINFDLLSDLSKRAELIDHVGLIFRSTFDSSDELDMIKDQIGTIILNNLKTLSDYLGMLFAILRTSDAPIRLKGPAENSGDDLSNEQSTNSALQVFAEHWKIVRFLIQVNDHFYESFCKTFGECEELLCLVYNLFSAVIYHDKPNQCEASSSNLNPTELTEQSSPERRSILNIFHFNDELIDNQLLSDEFFYSSTASDGLEDEEYSMLRELANQKQFPTASQEQLNNGKLERTWSLFEKLNIRQVLTELVDEYFPKNAKQQTQFADLPEQARQLLSAGGIIRKRLAMLVELMLSTLQLLVAKDNRLEDAMQSALIELKKLLLSGALENWDSPEVTKNVMNALQSLLKIAEVRSEVAGFEIIDGAQTNEYYFPAQSFSDVGKKSVNAEDDLSSTDESYTTAFDVGYEGDVENDHLLTITSRSNSSMRSRDVGSIKVNQNICNIVIDILVELSKKCAIDPQNWCPTLSQMIMKLNGIKDHLGGSLYLITGFGPVLERSDVRLKELQTSILELITDLDSPEVFSKFIQLLSLDDPPVQLILTKMMNIVDTTFKLECYTEISFPDKNDDGSRISTCDALLSKKINYLREHHKYYNIRSPFTCSAKMIPLSYVNFSPWNNTEGFTASVWFRLSVTQQDINRLAITHLISVGSEKQIISVYINHQRQFTVRFNKPDRIISSANTKRYLTSAIDVSCCDLCARELSHIWSYKNFLRSIEPSAQVFRIDTPGAQCVYCYKHLPATTKTVGTTSLSKDYFYDVHSEQFTIKELQLVEDQWTSLAMSVQQLDNSISVVLTLNGVQQQSITIIDPCQIHFDTTLPVLCIGHRIGVEDDCPLNYSLSNVQLFRKSFTDVSTLANLHSLGPNWIHLTGFLKGEIVPNYGNLNLAKLSQEDLHPRNHFQLLHRTHIGSFAAHKPDVFITSKPGYGKVALGMINFSPQIVAIENHSLQRSIQLSGGITTILFAFARIVELSDSPRTHADALNLLLRIAHDNNDFYNEFVQRDLLELVGIVLKNKKCQKEVCVLAAMLQVTFDQPVLVYRGDTYNVLTNSVARIRYPEIIVFFFENFQIWIDHSEEILNLVFKILITITRDKHPGMDYNCKRLADAGLVPTLIDFCRMNFVIPPKTVKISETAADWLVTLIKNLSSTPPKVSLLKEIIDLLLLMHKPTDSYVTHDRQKFYFNINPHLPSRATKSNENKLPQRLNLRERRLRYSQLRKVIPLAIVNANNSSFESTTSFIEMEKLDSKKDNSLEASPQATLKSSQCSPTAENYQANYEKLNQAFSDVNICRSLKNEKRSKTKVRRLQKTTTKVSLTPRERTSPSKAATGKELNHSTQSLPTKFKFFEQNYFGTGNDFIQESFLKAMCDFLLILPDQEAKQFFCAENQIIETLLILANNSNIRIRTMIISLIAVISDRVLTSYTEEQFKIFWHHLGNQIGSHSVNIDLLNSCFRWITKAGSVLSLESLIFEYHVNIVQECGLNVLMAILPQSHTDLRLFQLILNLILYIQHTDQKATQYMVDNGLVGTLVKTLVKMHEKDEVGEVVLNRDSFLAFITSFAQRSLITVNFINPFWDLINGLILAERHKNPKVAHGVRDIQALFYRNILQLFIYRPTDSIIGHKNNSFTVDLPSCTIPKAEIKVRYNQIHDKAVQFITNCDADHQVFESEVLLIKSLMNRTLNGNPRGGNIILWCLMPKRAISLKLYTIRQLGQYLDGGNYLSLICDVRMLKVFSHSILLLNSKDLSVEDLAVVNTFYNSIDGSNNNTWSLPQTLEEFEYLRTININEQEQTMLKSINKQEKLIHTCTIAAMEITRNIVEKQNKLRKELIIQLKKDNDFKFFNQWRQIIEQMTHEDAPWYNEKLYPASWELDDTYGPSMIMSRMRRCRQIIEQRFLQKDFRTAEDHTSKPLLDYLIPHNRSQEFSMENQVLYTWTVRHISPKDERDSECILTSTELVLSLSTGDISIYDLYDITKIWKKRYQHQETAVEIFLRSEKSLFLVFDRPLEREQFVGFFHDLVQREGRQELDAHTQAWREGSLSNWEYLMHLNQISGRSYHDLMQYPVLPWILADYEGQTLDLLSERVFRNLEKPIAVQYKDLEKHYINNYNYLKQSENDSLCRQPIQPYHYSSHYSNSGTVLHFLVRMLPFTSLFLQYQDNSFDIPDRTFHSLATTWKLASKDSPTDVKELIPQFYCCPEFLENCEGFDFGLRQSGEPVNHVELPPWCRQSARLFVLIHRQALESDHVRKTISSWIDLIFGYKQTGSAAVEAINVFHPATYANFNATDIDDPVEKLALETMVKTYGQMPRQLFDSPHPQSNIAPLWANPPEVVEAVSGLKWGLYCGSPVLPNPKIVDIRGTLNNPSSLTQLENNKVVALPARMNIFRGRHTKAQYIMDWGHQDDVARFRSVQESDTRSSELVYNTNMDPITACGSDPNCPDIWFGHQSGRIAVFQQRQTKKMSFFNSNIQPSVTRKRSSSFRKWIDRKSATLRRRLEGDEEGEEGAGSVPIKWNFPITLIKHRAEITAIAISTEFKIVVSVSVDGTAAIWDYNTLSYVREIPKPVNGINSKISLVAISPTMGDIVTIHSSTYASSVSGRSYDASTLVDDESFEVTENYNMDYVNVAMASSRDQLRLHTINAKYVEHVFMESPVMAVCYSSVKEGCGVNCIAVGMENGVIRLYSSWNLAMVREIALNMSDLFGIKSLIYSKNQHLIVLLSSNMIQTWKSEGLPGISPQITELPVRRSIG